VRGHQDNAGNKELPIGAKLKILMESIAKEAHIDPNMECEKKIACSITVNGRLLSGKFTTALRKEIITARIRDYYKYKFPDYYDAIL